MRIQNFEDVIAWQKGKLLYIELTKDFRNTRDYTFRDQLFRAALSITNNIAEGFDRRTDKELRQFLIISRGSCAEVRSMLHLAIADNLISELRHDELTMITISISKLLTGFIRSLETSDWRPETMK